MTYRAALPPFAKKVESIAPYDIYEVQNGVLVERFKAFNWDCDLCWCLAVQHQYATGTAFGDIPEGGFCHELPVIDLPDLEEREILEQELRQITDMALSELESYGIHADKKKAENYYHSPNYVDLRGYSLEALNADDSADSWDFEFSDLLTHFEFHYDLLPVFCYSQPDERRAARVTYLFNVLKSVSKLKAGISDRKTLFNNETEHMYEVLKAATPEGYAINTTLTDLFNLAFEMGSAKSLLMLKEHEEDFFRGKGNIRGSEKGVSTNTKKANDRADLMCKSFLDRRLECPGISVEDNKKCVAAQFNVDIKTVNNRVTDGGRPIYAGEK